MAPVLEVDGFALHITLEISSKGNHPMLEDDQRKEDNFSKISFEDSLVNEVCEEAVTTAKPSRVDSRPKFNRDML